jgi:hypothetical protein
MRPDPKPGIHRVDPEFGSTLKALIGIHRQTAGSTCEFWVNPVNFTFYQVRHISVRFGTADSIATLGTADRHESLVAGLRQLCSVVDASTAEAPQSHAETIAVDADFCARVGSSADVAAALSPAPQLPAAPEAGIRTGGEVITTPPCLLCMDNHEWNIQGCLKLTLPPVARFERTPITR